MKAHFFNVGHGDMSLVEVAGKNILVDCNITDDNGALADILKIIPNKQIDYFIITHLDKDHITGIEILKKHNFEFGKVYESGFRVSDNEEKQNDEVYKIALKFLETENTKVLVSSTKKVNDETEFDIYCYNSNHKNNDDIHYNSLVVKIVENGKAILFTGDSNCEIWKDEITDNYSNFLDSDILHASHHGSRTFFFVGGNADGEVYEEHVELVSPKYVIVSAPKNEDKREDWPPHEDALKIYEEYTARDGSVEITGEKEIITFNINSESCSIGDRPFISENHRSIPGRYHRKTEISKIYTSEDTKQTSTLFGRFM